MEEQWEAFEELLKTHDWYYMMSDDQRYYGKGRDESNAISKLRSELQKHDADRSDALYEKYVKRNY